jgi:hypothetical protein
MDVSTNTLRDFGFIDVPLHCAPEYEALSYCWKDTRICTGIFFNHNGCETIYRLTEDLATFLYSIIKTDDLKTPEYLWIDQICINQENINERNSQVACMADIYRRASRVIVWLGQQSDESCVQQGVAAVQSASKADADSNTYQGVAALVQTVQSASILLRPWFTRLWVFQEVVLAGSILVLIGERSFAWKDIIDFSELVIMDWVDASRTFLWGKCNADMVRAVDTARKEMASSGCLNIIHWLPQLAVTQNCRDPRDYVYGLLGCVGNTLPPYIVDYQQSSTDVFRDANRFFIERYKSLQIIVYIEKEDEYLRSHINTPSWSPYWGKTREIGLLDWKIESNFSASGSCAYTPSMVKHANKLEVRGKIMGTVCAITDCDLQLLVKMTWATTTPRDLCDKVWPDVSHRYRADNGAETPISDTFDDNDSHPLRSNTEVQRKPAIDETLPFDFIRDIIDTICCHADASTPPLKLHDHSLVDTYRVLVNSQLDEKLQGEGSGIRIRALVCQAMSFDKSIAVLKDGRLALVWSDTVEVGDKIAILHGLTIPCVLRKVDGADEWTVQGDAFVKDWMHGEGVTWAEDEADTFILV